jgi:hypothetical protein
MEPGQTVTLLTDFDVSRVETDEAPQLLMAAFRYGKRIDLVRIKDERGH